MLITLKAIIVQAEEFHKAAHTMLEWLSDVENKLKYTNNTIPDNERDMEERLKNIEVTCCFYLKK